MIQCNRFGLQVFTATENMENAPYSVLQNTLSVADEVLDTALPTRNGMQGLITAGLITRIAFKQGAANNRFTCRPVSPW